MTTTLLTYAIGMNQFHPVYWATDRDYDAKKTQLLKVHTHFRQQSENILRVWNETGTTTPEQIQEPHRVVAEIKWCDFCNQYPSGLERADWIDRQCLKHEGFIQ